ncbi:RagB/SusD family nutrient uptake outer membrane protein [Spirosoma sp. KCTC 42546]|uniref:RagB/SusD family nutrient uptake outer membrane protein n=1 Tax=Spirosoma sp. KCTC 42546 TaxID=2520506 RepID=UPI00115AABD9|nr:RagB/SusD family nutrient uptake outer membrane protein [Spirosoma sp. KCTC 42546]QDK81418.1 RagB/SusD family nutrient uptake outer membrane protein [Spirosoma sp. KCTC 42546]
MKNTIIKGALVTAMISLVTFACKDKFLDVPATGQLALNQITSKAGFEGLLLASYAQLNGRGYSRATSSFNWVRGSISGGDANKGSNSGDGGGNTNFNTFQRFEILPSNGDVNDKWRGMYEGISRANAVLRALPAASSDVSAADKQRLSAEARFLRAHYYFELKRSFNMVPYVDETVDYGSGIELVKNDTDIWPKIEADFKFAQDNLPETQSSAGRANKWAAATYLAKTYLYQKKYTEAKTLFDLVIANGTTTNGKKYALVANYTDVFNATKDNNEESIFAIQAAVNTGDVANSAQELDLNFPYNTGSNGPAGCCGFFAPSFELANSFRVSATGLPLLDGSYNTGANQLKNDQGIASSAPFTPDAGPVDPRLDWSIGRRGIPYLDWQVHPGLDWIRDQSYAGPFSPKKFVYYRSQDKTLTDGSSWTDGYSAINYNIIRFADVLLMAAEAEIEVGSLETARTYINQVRTRAANASFWVKGTNGSNAANYVISNYTTPFADKAAARTAVQFERKLELSGEGHRFYDLVRWGVASTVLNAYLAYESQKLTLGYGGAKFTAGKDEYLPIPQVQMDLQQGIFKQNPGY